MVSVISLFGETDFQPALKTRLALENIFFIESNCVTSVQLMDVMDKRSKEVDGVIILSAAINMDSFSDLVNTLRKAEPKVRIILILDGRPDNFLRSQINEYNDMHVDLIFDDDGFRADDLVRAIKKGKLSDKKPKDKRRESGFKDFDSREEEKPRRISEKCDKRESKPVESFTLPQCHRIITVFNAMHGAGATYTAFNLAKYFAIQNFKTCFLDCAEKPSFDKEKIGNVDVYHFGTEVETLKEKYNVIIADLGTPYEIDNSGENFKIDEKYNKANFELIKESSLKIIMGFAEDWSLQRTLFFLKNEAWETITDSSCIFIVPENADRIKKIYPEVNVYNRSDNYRDTIFELFREDDVI